MKVVDLIRALETLQEPPFNGALTRIWVTDSDPLYLRAFPSSRGGHRWYVNDKVPTNYLLTKLKQLSQTTPAEPISKKLGITKLTVSWATHWEIDL